MIGFCPLASGSQGNCFYIGTKNTKVLIDAGISSKALGERLSQIGVSINEIDAILITHEHSDHIMGLKGLTLKHQIPVFANSDTAKGIYSALNICPKFKIFSTGESFEFGDIEFTPFSVQHDTLDPVAFTVKLDQLKIGICTDLGFATSSVVSALQGCDYLVLEANHQPSMVHASQRPAIYKQRVLSRQGHLSNEECAKLLSEILHDKLKHVYLAHLSSECNSPELALKIVSDVLKDRANLTIAYQDQISQAIYF